jgi:hypothetical protein
MIVALVLAACSAAEGSVAEPEASSMTTLPPVVAEEPAPPGTTSVPVTTSVPTTTTLAPATTAPPTTTVEPEDTTGWYLVWVPVQLPEGFPEGIASIPGVGATSLVRSGNGFLVETRDRDGNVVDSADRGYVYPVEVNAYANLAVHSAFVSDDIASRFAGLRDDTVMLGETSARVRRLTPGATLTFASGETVTVAGIIDDSYVGDAEIVTGRSDTEVFGGNRRDRYMIIEYDGDYDELVAAAEALTDEAVVVRSWQNPRVARAGHQVRSQVAFKERFGEFAVRVVNGGIIQDPAWRAENIVTERIPLLGTVTCHRDFVEMLRRVMTQLEDNGYGDVIVPSAYRGCYNARFIAGRTDLSHHSWGAAADINFYIPPGRPGSPTHPALLQAMYAAGLTSGHTWNNPDPGHFEWLEDRE